MSSGKRRLLDDETDGEGSTTVADAAKRQKVVVEEQHVQEDDLKPAAILSESDETREQSADEKAILAMLDAVKADPTDTELLAHVCSCLKRLVERNSENLTLYLEEWHTFITYTMKEYINYGELLEKGGALIAAFCQKVENMEESDKIDGIWAIVNAIKDLQANAPIARNCCLTLLRMTTRNKQKSNEMSMKHVVDSDGIAVVVSAMEAHPNDRNLLAHCCGILMNLAACRNYNTQIVQEGGMQATIAAMRSHSNYEFVQLAGLGLLDSLLLHGPNNKRFAEDNGVSLCVNAMKKYPRDHIIQRRGCRSLSHVAGYNNGEYVDHIVNFNGITATIAAMKRHTGDARLQKRACLLLFRLTKGAKENKDALVSAGALEVLARAIQRHRNNEDTVKSANDAMRSLLD